MIRRVNPVIVIFLCLSVNRCDLIVDGKDEPPAMGKIVFTSAMSGTHQIYTINSDGNDLTQLTKGKYNTSTPNWRPDGQRIAFISDSLGYIAGFPIYLMDADGMNIELLPINPGPGYPLYLGMGANWSPNGTKIAYSHHVGDGSPFVLMIAILEDSTVIRTSLQSFIVDNLSYWYPDGSKLIFTSNRDHSPENPLVTNIYVINSDGSNQKRITDLGDVGRIDLSPDGQWIVFDEHDGQYDDFNLHLIDINGENLEQLTAGKRPVWSSDGKKIAFVRDDWKLYVIELKSKAVREIKTGYTTLKFTPQKWSFDDTELLVLSRSANFRNTYLDIINIKTGALRRLLQDGSINSPDWLQK